MRIEKIFYQKLVNNRTLGRARIISTPRKWTQVDPFDHTRKLVSVLKGSILGKTIYPIINYFRDWEYNLRRQKMLQRGLAWEDQLHHDTDLRRTIITEHMFRQNLHPYHWVLKMRRRWRYFKINHGLKGFVVPEYLQSEANTQTMQDMKLLQREWRAFIYNNYVSELSPTARRTMTSKKIILEVIMNFGIIRKEAYNKYFLNERDTCWYTPQEVAIVKDRKRFPYDLTTAEGKRRFEDYVTQVNENTPGIVAPEGQKFDFAKYYAQIGV